ncbi:glycosyltransferase [Nonlabens sp. Asnod3-A02]|uniref:glycosyltransferase n=1 Tax=Nonlabens sp. Asnod3-A02 TaxID=3160579 RepID=UPI00386E6F87
MKILIIVPVLNEYLHLSNFINSINHQTYTSFELIAVDDGSIDNSQKALKEWSSKRNIHCILEKEPSISTPGAKVIKTFYRGLISYHKKFDIICKFDADLILPCNYLERIVTEFKSKKEIGMVSGHLYIKKKDTWIFENISDKKSSRGPIKAYRTECFKQIGGLKASIGWDTIDEMLARFHGWEVVTIPELHVKHLKPTGAAYNSRSKYLQGEAFYKMRYGRILTFITAAKMAWNKKQFQLIADYLKGYHLAQKKNLAPLVTEEQGRFIRNYRWNGIKSKLGF